VIGWRHERQDKWLSRRVPSVIANRLIAAMTGLDVKDNGCTLKAFRAELIKRIPLYGEMHRFIPAIASTFGCQIAADTAAPSMACPGSIASCSTS
jgi:hypothetical protein